MASTDMHRSLPLVGLQNHKRVSLFATLRSLILLGRSRAALSNLTDSQLEDIGVTPKEAAREAKRPVWDVPQHWRL